MPHRRQCIRTCMHTYVLTGQWMYPFLNDAACILLLICCMYPPPNIYARLTGQWMYPFLDDAQRKWGMRGVVSVILVIMFVGKRAHSSPSQRTHSSKSGNTLSECLLVSLPSFSCSSSAPSLSLSPPLAQISKQKGGNFKSLQDT